jgi:hypothetical protein
VWTILTYQLDMRRSNAVEQYLQGSTPVWLTPLSLSPMLNTNGELSVVVVRCNMAKLSSGKNEPFRCFLRRDSGNVFERRSRAR